MIDDVQWVCFHGLFDFAYLLRLLTGEAYLPDDEYTFQETLKVYFPNIYDIKTMVASYSHLQGSLSKLCQELGICRIGTQHQAGSDSLVTSAAFFKVRDKFYSGAKTGLSEVKNVLYGVNSEDVWDKSTYDEECRRGFDWYNQCMPINGYTSQKWAVPMQEERKRKEAGFGRGIGVCIPTEAN